MKIEKRLINKEYSDAYKIEQSYSYQGDDYWEWSIWIDADKPAMLDKIRSVVYHLHHTFLEPVRTVEDRKTKFRLDTSGWGTFTIYIVLNLKDNSVVELDHDLVLDYPPDIDEDDK